MTEASFHRRCGSRVTLANGNRTAVRNYASQEFNYGLVISSNPLVDNHVFEVKIDKKVNSWSGSIEIGVTTCDPNTFEFPSSATDLREGSWIMSGNSIIKDGRSIVENYGTDLDKLGEGDRVGVMKSSCGELMFYVNGISQGVGVTGIPERVFAVVDLYGKCAQVTVVDSLAQEPRPCSSTAEPNITTNDNAIIAASYTNNNLNNTSTSTNNNNNSNAAIALDKLRFHERCGSLVKLSNNSRTAERRRPLDEFNNGVVMTHRALRDNELFEIRIDRLVGKWSGSIEVGVTTHNPSLLEFPATMTNMRSGTTMMSGCGILTNGKGTRREYGEFNLDELTEGDRIGMMRKTNGNLHYFINGLDQGVASTKVAQAVWGVVDLYGMTVKVTIVDRDEREEHNLITRRNMGAQEFRQATRLNDIPEEDNCDRLLFHPNCGSHAEVINNGRIAHRPNAMDDFNNAVVLTNRPLKVNELFEVLLVKMVTKWAGSIEIGVTTHSPTELEYPSTMTNVRSGTWMMTGNGIMHNGTTVIDEYGQNLDRLKVGDRVGVMRKESGTLHFYVNGDDQGPAATNVPDRVYGVIDLYGQAAQATIGDAMDLHSPEGASCSVNSTTLYSDLRFHHLHGRNARVSNNGLTACRPHALGEFNDAIVISNRPLREGEMFEVVIERMVDRWSGSIEAGVTGIRAEDLEFPNTMTDIDHDTWMLSGTAIMQNNQEIGDTKPSLDTNNSSCVKSESWNGTTVRNGYKCDLDSLGVGSRIGMMRHTDGTLHYYVNGEDQGVAFENVPSNVYAVIDLYGQCAQVSIVHNPIRINENSMASSQIMESSHLSLPIGSEMTHRFSQCCGKNVLLKNNNSTACRLRNFNHGLVFSSAPLESEETFEVRITEVASQWSGSLFLGFTTLPVSDSYPSSNLPPAISGITGADTWWISGSQVIRNGVTLKVNFCPSLDRLGPGDRVGVRRCADGTLRVYINGEDLGVAATNLPKRVVAVVDLYGSTESVTVSSVCRSHPSPGQESIHQSQRASMDSLEMVEVDRPRSSGGGGGGGGSSGVGKESRQLLEFHDNHGRNIRLTNGNLTARRTASYNQGIVVSSKPLARQQLFQVRIDKLNPRWTSSISLGVIGQSPEKMHFPVAALSFKKGAWIICSDCVFQNGTKTRGRYGPNLDSLQSRHLVGILVDSENRLHLFVNGMDQGVAAKDIPTRCYAVVDLYGQCEEVTVVSPEETLSSSMELDYPCEKADLETGKEKEKRVAAKGQPDSLGTIKNCEYQNACARFRNMLGLPDGYFTPEYNVCYCETCHKIRGDEAYCKKGDPPKDFAPPFGWCKFPLRVLPRAADNSSCTDKWHVAYHGTRLGALRRILDHGELLMPSELGLERSFVLKTKSKDEDSDGSQLLFSPTLKYAGLNAFAPWHEYLDSQTRRKLHAHVALQILVQPGSYKVGPPSSPSASPGPTATTAAGRPAVAVDPHFDPEAVEWVTKERGATMVTALLIHLEGLCP